MKFVIISDRIIIRHWTEADLPHLIQMNQDELVMKYFPSILSKSETIQRYESMQAHFEKNGFGLYLIENMKGEFLGYTGCMIADFESAFTPCIEIGWRFKKEYWGKGYATEAAKACLQYGFTELSFSTVHAFTSIHNHPSEAVMKRIGMQKKGEFDHPKIPASHHLCRHVRYQIEKDDYAALINSSLITRV